MPSKFTHLHVHSHYSLLDGLPKIPDLVGYVKKLGMDAVAVTDHGALYGAVEFFKEAKKQGIKPIIGCEMYMAYEGMDQKRPHIDDKRYHIVLLVKNERGYRNLVHLITRAHLEGFYYKPRIDDDLLAQHTEGLIALSACIQGKIPRLIIANRFKEAEEKALEYQQLFGEDNFYLELQHHPNISGQLKANQGLIKIAEKHGIPLVSTNDSHYLKPEDKEAQDILMLINTGSDKDDPERLTMMADDFSITTPEKMAENFREVPEAIKNTQKITEMCNFEFALGKTILPVFKTPENYNSTQYLRKLCEENLDKKYKREEITPEIRQRLNEELTIIEKTGFSSYFLIVRDFMQWAKEKGIIQNCRGSVAGSIVSYILGITKIDPLKHGLLFERFLTGKRISPPDIDVDFADVRRDEVIGYVEEKYGKDKVAQIITFGTMAARAVIRDVGRALGYSYDYCDKAAKMIPFGFSLEQCLVKVQEFRELYEQDEKARILIDFAKKLEGVARHASTHACAVVMSREPLTNIVPLQYSSQSDKTIITQYDMYSAEDIGLLKMDFLGLRNLTTIELTLKLIKENHGIEIDLDSMQFNDKKTFELLQKGKTTSVFQLECLAGDTKVSTTTLKKLYERRNKDVLHSLYIDEGKVHKNKIIDVVSGKEKELYALIAENGWYIKASKDHHFLTRNGWKKLEDLKIGEGVLTKTKCDHFIYNTCKICGKQINGQKEGKSNFCYRCSASFYKNPSKSKSRKKISEARKRFYERGGRPWNYGLNTENSSKMARTGKKISKALTGKTLEKRYGEQRAKEIKKRLSKRFSGEGNPMFGKPSPHRRGGFRQDLGHYVRSNWEADFARILKLYKLEYEYEPKTFRLQRANGEVLHYTPDFYVKSKNIFYEIKGWLHDLDQEKIELFKQQYPQYNFVLINTTKFAELSLEYKNLVKWECPRVPIKDQFEFIKIKEIKYSGKEPVYDIIMESPGNNYVANGFVVHNSSGMKRYLKQLKPTKLEDIIAMVALYRPGPMELIPEFIQRKHGKKQIEYLHPKLEPILENTYGIMIFQEQLMRISRDLAGFSPAEADVLRKAVGKKIKPLLLEQQEKFIEGAVRNNIPENVAKKIWQWILPFARYGFNRAHSCLYAITAYQTAYLKANYPLEFMTGVLVSENADIERAAFLIEECKLMGIKVLKPDINESEENFTTVGENSIRFGLSAIKNVGESAVEQIVNERRAGGEFKSVPDFALRVSGSALNKKTMESMVKAGTFDKLSERQKLLNGLPRLLEWARRQQSFEAQGQRSLFGAGGKTVQAPEIRLEEVPPASKDEKLRWEKELLGLYVTSHPLEPFTKILKQRAMPIKQLGKYIQKRVRIGGVVSGIKKILTKNGDPMVFATLEDKTGKIDVVVFPGALKRNGHSLQKDKIVFMSGRVDDRKGKAQLICDNVEEIVDNETIDNGQIR